MIMLMMESWMSEDFLDSRISGFLDSRIPDSRILRLLNSWITVFQIPGFPDYRILGFPYSGFPDYRILGFPDSWISGFLDSQISRFSCIPPLFFIVFFSLQIIEEACKKKLRKKNILSFGIFYIQKSCQYN